MFLLLLNSAFSAIFATGHGIFTNSIHTFGYAARNAKRGLAKCIHSLFFTR